MEGLTTLLYFTEENVVAGSEKKIPTSLRECYATDRVSVNLWSWSNLLEVWGKRVLILLVIIGIISTIGDGIEIANIDKDLVFITVIISIIKWGLYTAFTYCSYNVLSLLVASLATIVQNTRITANVALYNTAKKERVLHGENEKSPLSTPKHEEVTHKWLCSACGKMRDKSPCPHCGNE